MNKLSVFIFFIYFDISIIFIYKLMLVQYQLKTSNAPKDVNLSSNNHSLQLNKVNKNKFTS